MLKLKISNLFSNHRFPFCCNHCLTLIFWIVLQQAANFCQTEWLDQCLLIMSFFLGTVCVGFLLEWGVVPQDNWYLPWPLWMVPGLGRLCLAALPLHSAGNSLWPNCICILKSQAWTCLHEAAQLVSNSETKLFLPVWTVSQVSQVLSTQGPNSCINHV